MSYRTIDWALTRPPVWSQASNRAARRGPHRRQIALQPVADRLLVAAKDALGTRQAHLLVKFHGVELPSLPLQEGKSGQIILRPQQDYPAATMDQFCIAVPMSASQVSSSTWRWPVSCVSVYCGSDRSMPRSSVRLNSQRDFSFFHPPQRIRTIVSMITAASSDRYPVVPQVSTSRVSRGG